MKIIDFDVTVIEQNENFDIVNLSMLYDIGLRKDANLIFDKGGHLIAYNDEEDKEASCSKFV